MLKVVATGLPFSGVRNIGEAIKRLGFKTMLNAHHLQNKKVEFQIEKLENFEALANIWAIFDASTEVIFSYFEDLKFIHNYITVEQWKSFLEPIYAIDNPRNLVRRKFLRRRFDFKGYQPKKIESVYNNGMEKVESFPNALWIHENCLNGSSCLWKEIADYLEVPNIMEGRDFPKLSNDF
jgi:hypothetical protein